MRHVILVILLVGAAFLGGAFVNGPGLQWAQTQVLGTLGFNDEIEIASVDLKRTNDQHAATSVAKPGGAKPKTGETSQKEPVSLPPTVTGGNDPPDSRANRPKRDGKSGRPDLVGIAPVMLEPPKPAAKNASEAGTTSPAAADLELLPPLAAAPPSDGSVVPAVERGNTVPGPAAPPSPGPERGQAPAILDALASFLPPSGSGSAPPASAPASKDKSPAVLPLAPSGDRSLPGVFPPGASKGGGDEWAELGRKMKSLGVTRFAVEGEPGGRVIFSCLIPLAGKQAVSQRFEADGDDLVQAVQATLRRITLWKTAQPPESP